MIFCVFNMLLSQMIYSSFKFENLVIMQVLTASSFWSTCQCTVKRYYASHFVMKLRILFNFYSALMFLLESTKTSSMVEKSLNKSFRTAYTFLGGSKYQTSNDVIYPQCKSLNKHSSTLTLKDREFQGDP